jgi:hypothetical protein
MARALLMWSVVDTTNDNQIGAAGLSSVNRICLVGAAVFAVAAAVMASGCRGPTSAHDYAGCACEDRRTPVAGDGCRAFSTWSGRSTVNVEP